MRKLVTVVALMALASLASADIIVPEGTTTGLYKVTNPSPMTGFVSYTLVWVGETESGYLSAFDGYLTGTLSQIQYAGTNKTTWAYPSGGWIDSLVPDMLYLDTHILIPQAAVIEAQPPVVEDVTVVLNLQIYEGEFGWMTHGTGTYMKARPLIPNPDEGGDPIPGPLTNMSFAIPLNYQQAVTPLMQIVTTTGTAYLNGILVPFSGEADAMNVDNLDVSTIPEIPEPTALILLGAGALGAVVRKRRRA